MLRWHLHIYKWWKWQKGSREEHFLSLFWTLMSSLYPSSLLNIAGVGVSFKCEHWKHPWAKCWLLAKCNGRARFMLTFSGWRLGASGRRCFLKWFLSDISQILIRHCPKIIWTLLEKLSLPSLSYVICWQRGIQLQLWSSLLVNPCCCEFFLS